MSNVTQAPTLPRSRPTLLVVALVVAWTVGNIVSVITMAAAQKTVTLAPSTMGTIVPVAVAVLTALAYILVVRRAPSAGRWIWCTLMVAVMAMTAWASVQRPQTGQHIYGFKDVVGILVISLVVVGPLLWFYRRPAKAKPTRG